MATTVLTNDPFADVDVYPIVCDGRATDKVMIRIKNDEGAMIPIPGLGGVRSEGYALIPNLRVRDVLSEVLDTTGYNFVPIPMRKTERDDGISWDGSKRFALRWMCRELADDVGGRHTMALGVEAQNSYDGTASVKVSFFLMNMACENQFHTRNRLDCFRLNHNLKRYCGNAYDQGALETSLQQVFSDFGDRIAGFTSKLSGYRRLHDTPIGSMDRYLEFRDKLNASGNWARSRDAEVLDELRGCGITSRLGLQQTASTDNLFGVLNAYTAVATHHVGEFNDSDASAKVVDFVLGRYA